MKYIYFFASIFLLAFFLVACQPNTKKEITKIVENTEQQDSVQELVVPNFTMKDVKGNILSLNSEIAKNKVTIIDFWASWCGPCMREVPNLVQLYTNYKAKGLGIVSISLDESEENWKETIKESGMKWTHLSDLQGWNNVAARLYGVQSIPYIIVVDAKGRLLTQDIRGEELRTFIAEKLK